MGAERKRRRLAENYLRDSLERAFQAYMEFLETITSFKYLVRVMMAGDDNWPEVADKLRKSRKIWMRMTRIIFWEGADPRTSGLFFKVVVQAVLLLGSETWVLTPLPPQLPPGDPLRNPVLDSSQGLLHTGGQYPCL